ncbi:MAG TPA: cold shock domain-containing protein [Roseiarcus sp.]|nr:cold shock domain-containing protein [Roseiarcus sp.]
MNTNRNFWATRRHGFDDDEAMISHGPRPQSARAQADAGGGFAEAGPTPESGQMVAGVVKWFNEHKGYGFVELAGGQGDAFLHVNVLKSTGRESVPAGAKLRIIVGDGPKGPQVASVVDIDASGIVEQPFRGFAPARPLRGPRRPDPSTAVPLSGKVKWFDEGRGFGFVASEDGGKDIFVHISTVSAAGVKQLAEGQLVNMRVVETSKGREAIAIAL